VLVGWNRCSLCIFHVCTCYCTFSLHFNIGTYCQKKKDQQSRSLDEVENENTFVGTLQTEYSHAQDLSLVPQRQTSHSAGKRSSVTVCPRGSRPVAPDPLLVPKSFSIATCPTAPGTSVNRERLRCRHVSYSSKPVSRCGRALASPHATGLTTRREGL
jgi:hypothetical protein